MESGFGRRGEEAMLSYSLPNLHYSSQTAAVVHTGPGPGPGNTYTPNVSVRAAHQAHVSGSGAAPTHTPISSASKYPDRKALYLLGQTPNDSATQKWLNKLIARREQRNSQFLERLKQKQAEGSHTHRPSYITTGGGGGGGGGGNQRITVSRGSTRNLPPHRLHQQLPPQTPSGRSTRLPPANNSIGLLATPRNRTRPNYISNGAFTYRETDYYLSQSTGMLPQNGSSPGLPSTSNARVRVGRKDNEITVDLTKSESTTNIAYRLLGAYVERNPTPLTRTFMNIGEAPSTFVDEYLQDRCSEKLDYKSICNLWIKKLSTDWEIVEE